MYSIKIFTHVNNTKMADTTQINFRIPVDLKIQAQEKAESYGTNLNFLVKLFLTKFVK